MGSLQNRNLQQTHVINFLLSALCTISKINHNDIFIYLLNTAVLLKSVMESNGIISLLLFEKEYLTNTIHLPHCSKLEGGCRAQRKRAKTATTQVAEIYKYGTGDSNCRKSFMLRGCAMTDMFLKILPLSSSLKQGGWSVEILLDVKLPCCV